MQQIKTFILKQVAAGQLSRQEAAILLREIQQDMKSHNDDLAVIGMACRFPGAANPDEFWANLEQEKNCIGRFPPARRKDMDAILMDPFLHQFFAGQNLPDPANLDFDKIYRYGGFLNEVDTFDAGFFKIPPKEAKYMDPLHRLFLQTAWEAIEDAGYGGGKINGTNTGVYVGRDNTTGSIYRFITEQDQMHLTGSWTGILASRISYIYNLTGPAMVIDTACSSGLSAVHEACRALKDRRCDMALAAGVHISLLGNLAGAVTMDMVEAEDSTVRTFDKSANGTVWGEGLGVILLKPLARAMADGDAIHAVIKGSALNNDGASNGITAPNAEAQEAVIVSAWKDAGINPETLGYIEAHGTGTLLGDPVEIKGLTNAFRRYTGKNQFCGVGSVKTSIGHTVGASGLASAIKVILGLKNKQIPASLHFDAPNPYISFIDSPLYINERLSPWEKNDSPRRAGISSFGFSGTNGHLVLEEAPESAVAQPEVPDVYRIFTLSGRTREVLQQYLHRYLLYVQHPFHARVADICYTAATGRDHHQFRIAFIMRNGDEFKQKICILNEDGIKADEQSSIFYGEHKLAPESRKHRQAGEITETEKRAWKKEAEQCLAVFKETPGDLQNLQKLCRLYVKGTDIKWDTFYTGETRKRVHLPVYPFEKTRLWADLRAVAGAGFRVETAGETIHPLVERLILDTPERKIFLTHLQIGENWVLDDHKVAGNFLIPGTAYLEMARVAAAHIFGEQPFAFQDFIFIKPLVVLPGENKEIQMVIEQSRETGEITISGRDPASGNWTVHARAKISRAEAAGRKVSPGEVRQRTGADIYKGFVPRTEHFEFGPHWNNLAHIYPGEQEALIHLCLPPVNADDLKKYFIHPAMMDNAMNTFSQSIGQGMYLPFMYKSLRYYDRMPDSFYCYMKKVMTEQDNPEAITFNAELFDEAGRVFMEIENYTVKRIPGTLTAFNTLSGDSIPYYALSWQPAPLTAEIQEPQGKTVLISPDYSGAADLASALATRKVELTVCFPAQGAGENGQSSRDGITSLHAGMNEADYSRWIETIAERGVKRVIYLAGHRKFREQSPEQFQEYYETVLLPFFKFTRALLRSLGIRELELVLVTRNAYSILAGEQVDPLHTALAGLVKVVQQENPGFECRTIDWGNTPNSELLINELAVKTNLSTVGFRNGQRYCQVFARIIPEADEQIAVSDGKVYLITGGLGGIGLECALSLARSAKVHLILLGRSPFPAAEEWDAILELGQEPILIRKIRKIREILATGSTLQIQCGDVTRYEELNNVLTVLREQNGPFSGIIHAAGLAGAGLLVHKQDELFEQVLAPKVRGTFYLDCLTARDPLDFFVLFSSITTLTGGAGQGDYTTANAFMDGYAAYARQTGRRAILINWPGWRETGMAADYKVDESTLLFRSFTPEQGTAAFNEIIRSRLNQVIPGQINYELLSGYQGAFPFKLDPEIYKELQQRTSLSREGSRNQQDAEQINVIGLDDPENQRMEILMAGLWAKVLGLSEIDIYESLNNLGGDSIMASDLLRQIDKMIPGVVTIGDLFNYTNVIDLCGFIRSKGADFPDPVTSHSSLVTEQPGEPQNKSTFDNVILPFHQPPVAVEQAYAIQWAILSEEPVRAWLLNYYMQLVGYPRIPGGYLGFDDTETNWHHCPLLDARVLDRNMYTILAGNKVFADVLADCITNGYYVFTALDQYYNRHNPLYYQKEHFFQHMLFYGYDKSAGHIFSAGFYNQAENYEIGKTIDPDSLNKGGTLAAGALHNAPQKNYQPDCVKLESLENLILIKRNRNSYVFDVELFRRSIEDFLNATNTMHRYEEARACRQQGYVYGLENYRYLALCIKNSMQTRQYTWQLAKAFLLLVEHKGIMLERLAYLRSRHLLSEADYFIREYEKLKETAGEMRDITVAVFHSQVLNGLQPVLPLLDNLRLHEEIILKLLLTRLLPAGKAL